MACGNKKSCIILQKVLPNLLKSITNLRYTVYTTKEWGLTDEIGCDYISVRNVFTITMVSVKRRLWKATTITTCDIRTELVSIFAKEHTKECTLKPHE